MSLSTKSDFILLFSIFISINSLFASQGISQDQDVGVKDEQKGWCPLPSSIDIPLSDEIYQDIDRVLLISGAGAIRTVRPVTRLEAARWIIIAEKKKEPESGYYLSLISKLKREFEEEIALLGSERRWLRWRVPPPEKINTSFYLMSGGYELKNNMGDYFLRPATLLTNLPLDGYLSLLSLYLDPRLFIDDENITPEIFEGYGKLTFGNFELLAGREVLWWGAGREATFLLSSNPAPYDLVRAGNPFPFKLPWYLRYLGEWKVTAFWSILHEERSDVDNPEVLGMRIVLLPLPFLEIGATRLMMFDGEGRPQMTFKDFINFLFVLNPHVDIPEDPNQWDANELGSLDFRLRIPYSERIPGVDFIEFYMEYAGEDMVPGVYGFIKIPFLAGVAHLLGLYAGGGPFSFTIEWARAFDDQFRWYETHWFYKEGFFRDGLCMGHFMGGDATSFVVRLGYDAPGICRLTPYFIYQERWEVTGKDQEGLILLPYSELSLRCGIESSIELGKGFRIKGIYQVESLENQDFIEGEDGIYHLVMIKFSYSIPYGRN